MATCPACKGSRIRDDYKPAPLIVRLFGVRALLCDYCNHQFRAFSPLPPKSRKPRALQRKADIFNEAPCVNLNQLDLPASPPAPSLPPDLSVAASPLKQQKRDEDENTGVAPGKEPLQALANAAAAGNTMGNSPKLALPPSDRPQVDRLDIGALRSDLKMDITKVYEKGEVRAAATDAPERSEASRFTPVCPECGSTEVRRRQRTAIERAALSLTNHKAYTCRSCKASFYAKPDDAATATNNLADA